MNYVELTTRNIYFVQNSPLLRHMNVSVSPQVVGSLSDLCDERALPPFDFLSGEGSDGEGHTFGDSVVLVLHVVGGVRPVWPVLGFNLDSAEWFGFLVGIVVNVDLPVPVEVDVVLDEISLWSHWPLQLLQVHGKIPLG